MNLQSNTNNLSPKLKVCGLTKTDQIQELVATKVDFLGFIFYEKSPRYVLNHLTLEEISKIEHHGKTGVFVNATIDSIVETVEKAQLNLIQLHGDESNDFIVELKKKLPEIQIIKVIRVNPIIPKDEESLLHFKERFFTSFDPIQNDIDYILFDTDSKAFGGTGKTFDWAILEHLEFDKPYFLSGGISEENIGDLEGLKHQPFALDINSKFETEPGHKDLNKIKRFIASLPAKSSTGTI